MKSVTQSDIAKQLNVTRITVSKALRDHSDISVEMKKKVKKLAKEMGYTPNLLAMHLSTKKTNSIGIVVPDLENSFFAFAVDSIIDRASENGYRAIVTISRESEKNEKQNIQTLLGLRVEGLLICVSQSTTHSDIFQQIRKMNTPLVFFDREFEGLGFSSIVFGDRKCAFEALNQVIKMGYCQIAHFSGYQHTSIGRERFEGYKQALAQNHVPIHESWIIEGGFEREDGYRAFHLLKKQHRLPEVIFTVNDRVAWGAYKAAQELGLRIPQDIGIFGFGHAELAETLNPPLTIIRQDPRKIGKGAVDLVLDEINDGPIENPQKVILMAELEWNQSLVRK